MNLVEEILQLQAQGDLERGSRYVDRFRGLTIAQAQELVRCAFDVMDGKVRLSGRIRNPMDVAEDILLHLACLVPGALNGHHAELIARKLLYPPQLFLGADAPTRDQLLAWLTGEAEGDTELSGNHLLLALAWIGDETVQSVFRRWRANPPEWRDALYIPPEDYAKEAGWYLDAQGRHQWLFPQTCYELIRRDRAENPDAVSPIRAILPHNEHCHWCGQPLKTLFSFDLWDARLTFLGLDGELLRIAYCPRCSCFANLFTNVDTQGGSRWSEYNVKPDYIGRYGSGWQLPQDMLILNRMRRSLYEAHQFVLWGVWGASQVGGHPMWIQDAEYPDCPSCHEPMPCIAQLQTEDIEDFSEGVTYAFLCARCMIAATGYQQS